MSIDRNRRIARRRRAQWGGALLAAVAVVSAPPLGVGSYALSVLAADYPLEGTAAGEPSLRLLGGALVVAIVLALTIGSVLLVAALVGRPRPRPVTMVGAISLIIGTVLLVALPLAPLVVFERFAGVPYLVAFALMGFGAAACASAWAQLGPVDAGLRGVPRVGARAGVAGALVLATALPVVLLAVGLLEAFIWGPESQTQGVAAADVWVALSAADASLAMAGIIGWAVIATLFSGLPLLVLVLTRRMPDVAPRARRRAIVVAGLFAGGMVATLHALGTFSLGMSIADTLPPYTGAPSAVGTVLIGLGSVLLACAVLAILIARPTPSVNSSRLREVTPAP